MVKLLVFAILLASSPGNGLIESLFRAENTCYSGCQSNYATTNDVYLEACKKGCDFKLHNEDCATQCISYSKDEQTQNCCQVGCTLSQPSSGPIQSEKPAIAVDPVPSVNIAPAPDAAVNTEPERPRSIILIRIRQRPSFDMPSLPSLFNNDPSQFFNNLIKQFQENANQLAQNVPQTFEQKVQDLKKEIPDFGAIPQLIKSIPIIRLPGNVRADSSSESSEQIDGRSPSVDQVNRFNHHPNEYHRYFDERQRPDNNRVQQFFTDVRSEWNDLVRKQPKIPVWIFLGLLLSSSAILWYMVMSLCRHTPSRDLSVRAQELIFHPYEYDAYEKEKIQPDDHPYEVNESLPIKVKLTNI